MRDEDDEEMRRSLPSLHISTSSLSEISKLSGANIALDTIPEKKTILRWAKKNNNEFRIKHKQWKRFKANKRNHKILKQSRKKIAKLLNIEIDIIDGDDRESKTIEMEKKYHI